MLIKHNVSLQFWCLFQILKLYFLVLLEAWRMNYVSTYFSILIKTGRIYLTGVTLEGHTAFLGRRYPYELQQRKGSCFPLIWCIVVRKQALVFLKTYGLKKYSSLIICKLALFYYDSPKAFSSSESSDNWWKIVILIKTMKGSHKLSFETIWIDVWSFWGFLEEKLWSK